MPEMSSRIILARSTFPFFFIVIVILFFFLLRRVRPPPLLPPATKATQATPFSASFHCPVPLVPPFFFSSLLCFFSPQFDLSLFRPALFRGSLAIITITVNCFTTRHDSGPRGCVTRLLGFSWRGDFDKFPGLAIRTEGDWKKRESRICEVINSETIDLREIPQF